MQTGVYVHIIIQWASVLGGVLNLELNLKLNLKFIWGLKFRKFEII